MKRLPLVLVLAVLAPPQVVAGETPSATDTLCAVAANPLPVDFEFHALCTATAECDPFTDQQCDGDGTCVGVDRSCSAGERGYVVCNGVTQYCGGECCGADGVCEYHYGCGCADPDCQGTKLCPCECSQVTNCRTDADCCTEGSICTSSGTCLCA